MRARPVDRTGQHGSIRIEARGLPVRACSAGCPGLYWGDSNLGSELFRALTGDAEWVLPRRLFGRTCPGCRERLWASTHPGRLRAVLPQASGRATLVEIEAPVLDCRFCGVSYLDAVGHLDSIREALSSLLDNRMLRTIACPQ